MTQPIEAGTGEMEVQTPLNVVLCWHMHQPWYQEGIDGEYHLPWVYLHAIKDYEDMVWHLEKHPQMSAVVNFAPVLLEQLDDYEKQLGSWLNDGMVMNDPMLNLLSGAVPIPDSAEQRLRIIRDCQRANAEKMIDPYPAYRRMIEPYMKSSEDCMQEVMIEYLSPQYFIDLLIWYHLAWLGHALKQSETSARLIAKSGKFDNQDRRDLVELIHHSISNLIPRYRALAESGQIELSMSPHYHPIVPLLNDMKNMECAQPDAPVPQNSVYPGGVARSRWHIESGIECFEHHFGFRPKGIWLSEGAVSDDAIALIEEYGFRWTASGEGVWRNSVHRSDIDKEKVRNKRALFHPYCLPDSGTNIYFRDDGLSDLVGFDYSKWNSVEAADDLVDHLTNIADFLGEKAEQHVVSIILDGENAWEYYPHNGNYFLDHLYATLEDHTTVRSRTYSEIEGQVAVYELEKLCAGSWVYGSFSTWIGERDKNRAWDLLCEAKKVFDEVIENGALDEHRLESVTRQLAICEGSDWFWWFGEKNTSESVTSFDRLYRAQLVKLYEHLGIEPPGSLDRAISVGGGSAENAGTMVRNV